MSHLPGKLHFFLGGHDLEMETIAGLLTGHQLPFSDAGLGWGASASSYREQIEELDRHGQRLVMVELENDLIHQPVDAIWIDHHGARAGSAMPTSLEQIFELLDLPGEQWSRHYQLVAANDRGYLPALAAIGATRAEMEAIRSADRAAQGVGPADEEAALAALRHLEALCAGRLSVARLSTSRVSPLVDRLDPLLGGAGYENLLVISPNELNFYGAGGLVERLARLIPAGWYGGSLPEYGYWGCRYASDSAALPTDVESCLKEWLQ
jgi:hypothetical protein